MGKPPLRAREEQARNLGRWLNANICSLNKPLHEHPAESSGNLSPAGSFYTARVSSTLVPSDGVGPRFEEQLKPYV